MAKYFGIISVLLILSCSSPGSQVHEYACLSHTRLDDNSGIDSIVAKSDLSKYQLLLLGGDMANLSSYDDSILTYLNGVFDVSNSKTLWAAGNHDYTNIDLLKSYTKKETYYAYYQDETVFIVLDTQKDSSKIVNEQLVFFNSVMDTVSESKNLVLLTHKLIWMRGDAQLEPQINKVSNGEYGDCSYCVQSNNFYEHIYPRLLEFKKESKQVFCVAGDIGFNAKTFEYKTKDGIQFLATGIRANTANNYFLKLSNDLNTNNLTYEFQKIEEL